MYRIFIVSKPQRKGRRTMEGKIVSGLFEKMRQAVAAVGCQPEQPARIFKRRIESNETGLMSVQNPRWLRSTGNRVARSCPQD
jgi:hypothetical protein